jgi:uncharacterized protein involved in response to NO
MNSRWQTFTAAPHRVFFLAGAMQGIFALLWWAFDLMARYLGVFTPATWVVPSIWGHAFLMLYGFFPFFIFGFLMTAAPNWVNGDKVKRAHYVPAFVLMASGVALFYPALMVGRWLAMLAVVLYLAGWMVGWLALLHVVMKSPHDDKRHAFTIVGVMFVGWLGAAAYLLWLLSDSFVWLHLAITGGIWLFLLPTFVSVSHRMVPFFTSTVLSDYQLRRPYWALFVLLGGMALHAALDLGGASHLLWLADLPMAAVALYLSVLWGFRRSFQVRLLAVLHVGFAWLGLSLALYALQSFIQFSLGQYVLGFAPLHALTIGYFSSMVLAMVTRVTLGHSGRNLEADATTWLLFLGFQFTALFRVLGDFPLPGSTHFYLAAALIWLACFILWGAKHIPMYLRPRVDGKPG